MLRYIIFSSVFIATTILVMQISLFIRSHFDYISKRLEKINPRRKDSHEDKSLFKEIYSSKTIFGRKRKKTSNLELNKLYSAGYRNSNSRRQFFIYKVILTLGLIFAALWFRDVKQLSMSQSFILGSFAIIIGWKILPNLWLSSRIKARQAEVIANLADTLDLLVICLEAGLSFDSAILKVANEQRRTCKILSDEFFYTNREILAGKPRDEALRSLSVRCGGQTDMKALVALIIQSEKFGSSMSRTLRVHAELLRFKKSQRIKEYINKVPTKLLFPIVFFILPSLFVILIGPAVISLMHSFNKLLK